MGDGLKTRDDAVNVAAHIHSFQTQSLGKGFFHQLSRGYAW